MLWQSRYPLQSDHLDGHRYVEAAIAGERIEFLVVTLEVGRIGRFQPGSRQPLIPDRVDGPANGRNVLAMGEDRVFLFGNANARKFARQVGEVGHFDACDIVEISGVVAIATDAVSDLPDPARNILHRLIKALPLSRNPGAVVVIIALTEARVEQRTGGFKTPRLPIVYARPSRLARLLRL